MREIWFLFDIAIESIRRNRMRSVAGGLLGVLVGIVASRVLARQAGWPVVLSPAAMAIAFGSSGSIPPARPLA